MEQELVKFRPSALGATPTRRTVLSLAAALGLGNLLSAEAKKHGKKRRRKKKRCPNGRVRAGALCAIPCEVNEDCGHPSASCHDLMDQSARVCVTGAGSDPEVLPPCPSNSSNECGQRELCVNFANYPVCLLAT